MWVAARPAVFRLVAGRVCNAAFVEHICDVLLPVALQGPLINLPDDSGGFRINDDFIFIRGVLLVTIEGKTADVLPLPALQVKDHADVLRQVLQVPFVDQAIDLPGFFIALDLCVGIVGHRDEADPPNGKQTVDVFFDQLHVAGKTRLCLAENDLELPVLRGLDHAVEVWTETVRAGVVLVTVDGIDVPAVVNGVVGQQGFLVLDAFGFVLLFVFVLFAEAGIDCAENLLHLLQGVTAQYNTTTKSVTLQGCRYAILGKAP